MKEGVVGAARKLARQVGALFVALGTITAVIGLVGALGAGVASSASVEPLFVAGNPTCADLGYGGSLKVDPPSSGQHSGGGLTVTVTIDGASFDWSSSTIAVDAVIVKGGPNANVYVYSPAATSDTDLHAPINAANGQPYGLSHIEFCFTPGGPTTTTTSSTTTTTAPTTTTSSTTTSSTTTSSTTTSSTTTSTTEAPTTTTSTTEAPTTTTSTTEAPTTTTSTTEAPTTTSTGVTVTTLGGTTTTAPGATTSSTGGPTVSTLQTPTTTAADEGQLPFTGNDAQALLIVGCALVGLGARLLVTGRTQRHEMY
jgi:hypothetical protein